MAPQYINEKAARDALHAVALLFQCDAGYEAKNVFALSTPLPNRYWVRQETPSGRKEFIYSVGQ